MSASRLSAAAAEWTPPPPRSDTPAQQADDACWPSAEELHQWEAYDWYEEEDGGDEPQQQHQQHPQLEEGDAVALLQSCYPSHAPALLLQLVQDCGGDVQLAATILCDVASEERRERIAAAAAATGSGSGSSAAASADAQSRRQAESFALSLEQFPSLGGPSSSSSGRPAAGNSSSSWAAKAASTSTSTGSRAAPGPQLQQQQRLRRPQLQAVSSTSGRQQAAAEVPWVETGAAVSQAYAQARAEARDHARVRNQCFMQATLAWQAGDKALAKELSAQGKAAAERMWAAHERAGGQIFSARNAQLPQQAGPRSGPAIIDLHGLHVQEARSLLAQQLGALADRQQAVVSVIVGAGKHTKGAPSARLGPAVEALVQELGYVYSQPQPGLLRVVLR